MTFKRMALPIGVVLHLIWSAVGASEDLYNCNVIHNRDDARKGGKTVKAAFNAPLVMKRKVVLGMDEPTGCKIRPHTLREARDYLTGIADGTEKITFTYATEWDTFLSTMAEIDWEMVVSATVSCNYYTSDLVSATMWQINWTSYKHSESQSSARTLMLFTDVACDHPKTTIGIGGSSFTMENRLLATSTSFYDGVFQVAVNEAPSFDVSHFYPYKERKEGGGPGLQQYFKLSVQCKQGTTLLQRLRSQSFNNPLNTIKFYGMSYSVFREYVPVESCNKWHSKMKDFLSSMAHRPLLPPLAARLMQGSTCWTSWMTQIFWDDKPHTMLNSDNSDHSYGDEL